MDLALLAAGIVIGFLVSLTARTFNSGYGLSLDLFERPQYVKMCSNCQEKLPNEFKNTLSLLREVDGIRLRMKQLYSHLFTGEGKVCYDAKVIVED
jgi:hypothetical protein